MFTIGQISKKTQVKVPTIRYYEQIGLIQEPQRTCGNQRRYSDGALNRLNFIKHTRALGISIDNIKELIDLSDNPNKSCKDADDIVNNHLTEVREKIAKLKQLEQELTRIADGCDSTNISNCYVIKSLSNHDMCHGDH